MSITNVPPDNVWFPPEADQQTSNGLDSKILITAVLSLVFVVALVVILHLYVRYILRRHHAGHRLRTINTTTGRLVISTGPTSHHPPKSGLDPSVIATLPTFAYQKSTEASAECAVCLSAAEEGEMVRLLPNCKHVFHVGCIDMWLHSHSTCPVCRASVEPSKVVVGEASAPPPPPPELSNGLALEGTSGSKDAGSASRLGSSFRRILSREWSGRRMQGDGVVEDVERQ